jgi:ATP-binding cassette subfamily B protein
MKKSDYGLWHLMCGILKIISPFKRYLFLTFLCIIVQLTYTLVLPIGMQLIIDKGIKNNDLDLIIYVISGLGIIYIIFTIAYLLDAYIMSILTARSLDNLRNRMINQVYFYPISSQENKSTKILARFSNDISTIENVFIRAISDLVYYSASIICCTILLFFVQWRLALVVIFLSPLLIIIPRKISQKATTYSYIYKTNQEDLLNNIQEFIKGQSIIRLFGLRNYMMNQYLQANQPVYTNGIKSNYLNSLVGVTTIIGTGFLLLIIVALGSILTVKTYMSVGTFIAFSAYLHNITGSTQGLSGVIPILYQSIGSMQRIDEFLENETRQVKYSDHIEVLPFENEICLRDVYFSYDGKKSQLRNINIKIPKGSLTAFVGTSGAGKSTISKLIMGFLLPGKGKIMIDEIDNTESSIELFRSQIGAVLQDTFLFNTSIKENIRYGYLDASDHEIQESARAAEIHDWIMTLPETYNTQVGESGEKLSGGQRQRIAIARALVRKPKILILDEAFSALDPATEFSINQTIKKLAKSITIISITHNLTSVYDFTHLFVMNDGIILEQGDHQQLLSQKGFYYELWQKQTGLFFNKDFSDVEISIDRLAKIPLLSTMTQNDLEWIKEHLITETFEQGKVILCQGDPGKCFYIVAKGVVEIEIKDSDNKVHHLGVVETGDYFGEISLFKNCPITATVRARSRTICLVLSRQHFQGFLDKYPELESHMKKVADRKLGWYQK